MLSIMMRVVCSSLHLHIILGCHEILVPHSHAVVGYAGGGGVDDDD